MDEADVLGDRIAIMSNGKLKGKIKNNSNNISN